MERLIFDGSEEFNDSILYTFVSENLDDAEEIFYDLYDDDIHNVAKEYMSSDRDTLYGLSIALEVNKATNKVEYKTIRLGIESDSDLTEYEVADIELDDEIGDAKARRHRKHIEEIKNQNNEIEIE